MLSSKLSYHVCGLLSLQGVAGAAEAAETYTLRQGLVSRLLAAPNMVPGPLQGPARAFVAGADPGL